MRFLIVNSRDPEFLNSPRSDDRIWSVAPDGNEKQVQTVAATLVGETGSYARNLRTLGHDTLELGVNLEDLDAQIAKYKPDVLLDQSMSLSGAFLRKIKRHVRLLVGNHRDPLPAHWDFGAYDLILSAVDNFVDNFRRQGIRSELLRFGFEPTTPDRPGEPERSVPVSFVGSLSGAHASRRQWLEYVGEQVPLQVWAPSIEGLPERSSIARGYQGAAWGAKTADIFRTSRITLNRHVDIAGIYAGNQRLFDATGAGCLLITDWKTNLNKMFDPGKEVVTYRTPEECVEAIQYYLEHDDEGAAIAHAGQQRTLRDHTENNRVRKLIDIVRKHI